MMQRMLMVVAALVVLAAVISAGLFFPAAPDAVTHAQTTPASPAGLPPTGGLFGGGASTAMWLIISGIAAFLVGAGTFMVARSRQQKI